jgi:type III secretory pathway component EscV
MIFLVVTSGHEMVQEVSCRYAVDGALLLERLIF